MQMRHCYFGFVTIKNHNYIFIYFFPDNSFSLISRYQMIVQFVPEQWLFFISPQTITVFSYPRTLTIYYFTPKTAFFIPSQTTAVFYFIIERLYSICTQSYIQELFLTSQGIVAIFHLSSNHGYFFISLRIGAVSYFSPDNSYLFSPQISVFFVSPQTKTVIYFFLHYCYFLLLTMQRRFLISHQTTTVFIHLLKQKLFLCFTKKTDVSRFLQRPKLFFISLQKTSIFVSPRTRMVFISPKTIAVLYFLHRKRLF